MYLKPYDWRLVDNQEKFEVQIIGLNENNESTICRVYDYKPYFYLKISGKINGFFRFSP